MTATTPSGATPPPTLRDLVPTIHAALLPDASKLLAYRLARFGPAIVWESNHSIAKALKWDGAADKGARKTQRAIEAMEAAGIARRYSPRAFWAWWKAEGRAAGFERPQPEARPSRFLVFHAPGSVVPPVAPRPRRKVRDGLLAPGLPFGPGAVAATELVAFGPSEHGASVMFEAPRPAEVGPADMAPLSCSMNMTAAPCAMSAEFESKKETSTSGWDRAIRDDAPRPAGRTDGSAGAPAEGEPLPCPAGLDPARWARLAATLPAGTTESPDPSRKAATASLGNPRPGSARNRSRPQTEGDRALRAASEALKAPGFRDDRAAPGRIAEALAVGLGDPNPRQTIHHWAGAFRLVADGVLELGDVVAVLDGLVGQRGELYRAVSFRLKRVRDKLGT